MRRRVPAPQLRARPLLKAAVSILLTMILALRPAAGFAWAETGHHVIAVVAFGLLSADEQTRFLALLEKHPRYAADFTPPAQLADAEQHTQWRIGRAGYWPDVISKNVVYDRPTWHFERGPALVIGDPQRVKVPPRPGPLPADATLETQSLHISQALPLCTNVLADKQRSAAERAIALCWIAHLVGDAHQPCHAGSLFMEKVFVDEDGDRGANRIVVKQAKNLHSAWDQLLGNDFAEADVERGIIELTRDQEYVFCGQKAVESADGLDPHTWLEESRLLAAEHVYTSELVHALALVARGVVREPTEIELSDEYLKNAGQVARVRASEAAHRLAAIWQRGL